MKNPWHSGVERARRATAWTVVVAWLLPLPTSAQVQSADSGARVPSPGVVFSSTEPVGAPGSPRGCTASDGGFWFGNQAAEQSTGSSTNHIRLSLANLSDQAITRADRKAAPEMQRPYRGRRGRGGRGDRAVLGLVLGAIGGFVAGGVIGAAVSSQSCNCSNPELHGFVIGAPIGAVVGGFLGFALARR